MSQWSEDYLLENIITHSWHSYILQVEITSLNYRYAYAYCRRGLSTFANYESKLKEVDLNKARLEREIDNLPVDTRFRERKIHDMTLRLDALYDTIVELEERIEDAKLRKSSIEMETITLDNIYKLMLNFGKLYDIISDEEKKSLITYLIKEIQIYPNGESEQPLKSIEFNFPIYRDGQEVRRLLWEKGNTVETVCLLSREKSTT